MPKISKSAFKALVKKLRENPESLRDTKFPDASTSNTAVQTKNLRLDVHRDTKDPTMATGIVQANSLADDRTVRKFIKGKTGGGEGAQRDAPSYWRENKIRAWRQVQD